jgi:fucokinase
VDTGCIWFNSNIINSLWSLISENDIFSETRFSKFVNSDVCLSFYADFVYPLSVDVTFESYCAVTPENGIKKDLINCRREIWNQLKHYRFGVVKLNPAKYMHFGTTEELFSMLTDNKESFTTLEWQAVIGCNRVFDKENEPTIINSFIDKSVTIPKESFVENSVIKGNSTIGRNTILSGINAEHCHIPDNVALHCVKLKNGKFVCRIYGITDNPKNSLDNKFLLSSVSSFYHEKDNCLSIWDAKLFCECDSPEMAVKAALLLYVISANKALSADVLNWQKSVRHSFNSSFNAADTNDFDIRRNLIEQDIRFNVFVESVSNHSPLLSAIDKLLCINDHEAEMTKLLQFAGQSAFPLNMRLYHALSIISKRSKCSVCGYSSEQIEDFSYGTMKRVICDDCFKRFNFHTEGYVQDSVEIKLPARINFCGSPTDAAPYCLEHGGTMLDGALLLNGDFPVTATVSRINDLSVVLESIDQHDRITIHDIDSIRDCGNPFDRFALHKAVILACGVVPLHGDINLKDLLEKYGGGLRLSTHARIPKGSGLGTSSIIAAASVAAINRIFGIPEDNDRVYTQVFTAEQLMNTGGGWQDQVGAYTHGIKLMSSKPGIAQTIKLEQLDLTDEVKQELNERFALVFSGQRRLARNVLREELNRIIENDPTTMGALDRIRKICLIMKFELERGNVTGFAKLITEQFELVKTIDEGASNTYIEYIFESCADLIDGKSICGAGGGGFLQLILKKGVSIQQLKERMEQTFGDSGVKVWEGDLIL